MTQPLQTPLAGNAVKTSPLAGCRVIAMFNGVETFGQEKANFEVLKSLRRRGAEILVGVNTLDNGGDVKQAVQDLEFPSFGLPFGCQWSKKHFREDPRLIYKCIRSVAQCSGILRNRISQFGATHIHIGNPLVFSYIYGALKLSRLPLIYRMGDEPPHGSLPNLVIWKSCIARSQRVVANSKFVWDSILRVTPQHRGKLRLIYNTAPELPVDGHASTLGVRSRHECEPFRLLYIGQISSHKGVEDLLDAVGRCLERKVPLRLDVVGGSIYSKPYEQMLAKRVTMAGLNKHIAFHGHVSNPGDFYSRADLLIVPTRSEEPAANVVLEAKKFGIPSVVYPSGGLPELVLHQQNGFVCREKAVEALVEGVCWFLDSPSRLQHAGAAAIEDGEKRFGRERFDLAWLNVYSKGLSGTVVSND